MLVITAPHTILTYRDGVEHADESFLESILDSLGSRGYEAMYNTDDTLDPNWHYESEFRKSTYRGQMQNIDVHGMSDSNGFDLNIGTGSKDYQLNKIKKYCLDNNITLDVNGIFTGGGRTITQAAIDRGCDALQLELSYTFRQDSNVVDHLDNIIQLFLEEINNRVYYLNSHDSHIHSNLGIGVWSEFGVNYKSLSKDDTDYFNDIGLRYIRTHIPYAPIPWAENDSRIKPWRDRAKELHDAGFHVLYGFSRPNGVTITASNWQDYADSVVAEATYCEANNVCDEFQIGNEMEQFNDDTTLTDSQLRANIRALATSVRAVFSGKVVYSVEYGSSGSTFGTYQWCQEGKGDIDILGANLYADYDQSDGTFFHRYEKGEGGIPLLNTTFGDGWMLTEFNVSPEAADFDVIPDNKRLYELRKYMQYIRQVGVSRAYLYQYRAYDDIDSNDSFYYRASDDTFRKSWSAVLSF